MEYRKVMTLKDGRNCVLRNATESDGRAVLDNFILTHEQTDLSTGIRGLSEVEAVEDMLKERGQSTLCEI